jgi:hypothetical protein
MQKRLSPGSVVSNVPSLQRQTKTKRERKNKIDSLYAPPKKTKVLQVRNLQPVTKSKTFFTRPKKRTRNLDMRIGGMTTKYKVQRDMYRFTVSRGEEGILDRAQKILGDAATSNCSGPLEQAGVQV